MKQGRWSKVLSLGLLALPFLIDASRAFSCSVCYGNSDSNLTQGAKAGILLLAGVIYTQLMLMGGVGAYWFMRARKLAREQAAEQTGSEPQKKN